MHRTLLGALAALCLVASPLLAQSESEAPTPIPRPESLGGTGAPLSTQTGPREPETFLTDEPQPVTLSARTSEDGPFIPGGLVWRIFDTAPDESGELAMLAKSEEASATFSLPPGDYVLHLAYGRAQASETLSVRPGPNTNEMVLEAGGLQLSAAIEGDVPIPTNLLSFDVFTQSPNGRVTVAENVNPSELLHLNAGVYAIESQFGAINAAVRAEVRVEPGEITQATLYHRAAQVNLKLVSEEGGEAIADVEWRVQTLEGETLFSDIGAFPSTVLAEGDYLVLAQQGESVYNREFEVQPGAPREVEILTSIYETQG